MLWVHGLSPERSTLYYSKYVDIHFIFIAPHERELFLSNVFIILP